MKNRSHKPGSTTSAVVALVAVLASFNSWLGISFAAGEYLTLDTFAGHPGVTVIVRGGGFSAGETVRLTVGTTGITTESAALSDGEFGPVAVTVPANQPQGALIISGEGLTSHAVVSNSYYVQPFTPSISTTATANTPGGVVTVEGAGFAPNEDVRLVLGSASASGKASAAGVLSATSITIPTTAAGVYQLTATGLVSGASATNYFYVGGFFPSLQPSTYYLMPGVSLSFSGSGFMPHEALNLYEGESSTVIATDVANATGGFMNAAAFTIPTSYAGTARTFTLKGMQSGGSASVGIQVGQFFPNVSPTEYYVLPGSALSFNGNGFAPGEIVEVRLADTTAVIATVTADEDGVFEAGASVAIPYSAAGTAQSYTLTGTQSRGIATVGVTIGRLNPQLSPSEWFVVPGKTLNFSGVGFAKNETLSLYQGLDTTSLAGFSASMLGAFDEQGNVLIPYGLAGGSATYRVVGDQSGASASVQVSIGQLNAQINPSSYYLKPAEVFAVSGVDFAANETVVISADGVELGSTTADAMGGFAATGLVMPNSAMPSITLTATGATSGAVVSRSISVGSYYAYGMADAYYVTPGSTVTVEGHGFAPNEMVTVAAGTQTVSIISDEFGSVAPTAIVLPFGGMASQNITMVGAKSGATATVTVTLAPFMPSITPSTYYATPGSLVSFTGNGFVPNETVSITLGNSLVATVSADAMGLITTGTMPLPFGAEAVYSFTGALSQTPVVAPITLAQFYAGLALDQYYAVGGTPITLSGSGFAPLESVALTFAGNMIGSVSADGMGVFSSTTTVPYAVAGSKLVTATGAQSKAVAATTFTQAPVYTSVQLGAYAGPAGSAVQVIGSGFMAGETVEISADRTGTLLATAVVAADGTLTSNGFVVPIGLAEGELAITVTGRWSLTPQTIVYYVTGN